MALPCRLSPFYLLLCTHPPTSWNLIELRQFVSHQGFPEQRRLPNITYSIYIIKAKENDQVKERKRKKEGSGTLVINSSHHKCHVTVWVLSKRFCCQFLFNLGDIQDASHPGAAEICVQWVLCLFGGKIVFKWPMSKCSWLEIFGAPYSGAKRWQQPKNWDSCCVQKWQLTKKSNQENLEAEQHFTFKRNFCCYCL